MGTRKLQQDHSPSTAGVFKKAQILKDCFTSLFLFHSSTIQRGFSPLIPKYYNNGIDKYRKLHIKTHVFKSKVLLIFITKMLYYQSDSVFI